MIQSVAEILPPPHLHCGEHFWIQPQLWEPHRALPEHPDLCNQGRVLSLKSLYLILDPRVEGG